jgi:lipoprotein-anchoring transpeptidase ErfK/SrfK
MHRRRRTAAVVLTLAAAVVAVVVSAASLGSPRSQPAARAASTGTMPSPVSPAFQPGAPHRLGSLRHLSVWAPVNRSVTVHTAPAAGAPAVTQLSAETPEGTRNVVVVLERRQDRSGRTWTRVALAILPNGSTGWVPRSALGGYGTLRTRLDVDLGRLEATLYRDGRAVFRAPVGVGGATTPTPTGRFYVRNRLSRYSSPTYGPVAFGISARSPTATDWPAGGFVGIHGTDRPDLLPGRISHGCIRMTNADILELARLMPVGTPVHIR